MHGFNNEDVEIPCLPSRVHMPAQHPKMWLAYLTYRQISVP